MKRLITGCLCMAITMTTLPLSATDNDITEFEENTDALYRVGDGAYDGSYTALSKSMLGWGVGLALGIGILCAVLHQSTASSHSH